MDSTEPSNKLDSQSKKPFRKKSIIIGAIGLLLTAGFFFFNDSFTATQSSVTALPEKQVPIGSFPITVPNLKYGFALDTFQVIEREIQNGEFLGDILSSFQMDYPSIEQLVANSKDVFDVRQLRVGKNYAILSKDTTQGADFFIYEPSVYEYIVFNLNDDLKVERFKRPVTTETAYSAGEIQSSLWNTMADNGMDYELIARMEDALQWSISFHHVQKGDQFRLVYDQNYIDGEKVGVGDVEAAYFKSSTNEYFAIYYDNGKHQGYYDLKGRPMKSSFLKAPVKYTRISSYYNLNRFHPILKRRKPHFGTDYAAPYGTPIYAVGNGVVTRASYTKGNGYFVKIKHDDTYQTQYLHMQKFGPGISSGVQVKQGQVIGYVGSSGLATGPHVCFRFWKNGKQVNHLNLNFPPPEPLPAEDLPGFFEIRDQYLSRLDFDPATKVKEMEEAENP